MTDVSSSIPERDGCVVRSCDECAIALPGIRIWERRIVTGPFRDRHPGGHTAVVRQSKELLAVAYPGDGLVAECVDDPAVR